MMTNDQLAAIEARANDYNRYDRCNELEVARKIIGRDIPALVAEVRRLRGQVEALAELVKEAYEMDSWCHDNDQIHKPLPFDQSDAAMNLNAILSGAESECADGN